MSFISCEQPKTPMKLSQKDFHYIDSLVQLEKKNLRTEVDSICKGINNVYYKQAVDSITIIRRAYIKKSLEN